MLPLPAKSCLLGTGRRYTHENQIWVRAPSMKSQTRYANVRCRAQGRPSSVNHRSVAPSTTIKTGYAHLQDLGTSSLDTSVWRCMRAYKRVRSPSSVRASAARDGGETFQNHKTSRPPETQEDCVCVALKQTPSRAAWILMTPHVILTLQASLSLLQPPPWHTWLRMLSDFRQALQLMPTTEEGRGLGLGTARVGRGTARGKRLLLGKEPEAELLGTLHLGLALSPLRPETLDPMTASGL